MLGGMNKPETTATDASAPRRHLTLFDSTSIIVGIIIGATIYESSPFIAGNVASIWSLLGAWLLGGLLSLLGALCYAELATAFPRQGGDFIYLSKAFGRPLGFLFAWCQLWVVRPGSIGAMAYVFARYADQLVPLGSGEDRSAALLSYAVGSVVVLSVVNILGVQTGKWTQNVLTTAKVAGLSLVAIVGLLFTSPQAAAVKPSEGGSASFGLAMILILFAYGGWNEMAYVGAEVRDPRKNILRALILGTVAVAAIYLVVMLAFLHAMGGLAGLQQAKAVAADVFSLGFGPWGGKFISLLIAVSALGAINGQVFTGARIYYAMGQEHRMYGVLGRWSPLLGTPVWSLLVQGAITLAVVVGFGWAGAHKGFEKMVIFTTPVFWFFLVLVGISLFVLRRREPESPEPYRVPLYPIVPIVFCLSSLYMAYSGVRYAIDNKSPEAFWSIGLLLVGVVLCFFDRRPETPPEPTNRAA